MNLSLGGYHSTEYLERLNLIPLWDELQAKGVILVCAAGNEYNNNDDKKVFPSCLPRDNVLSVMAVDPEGKPEDTGIKIAEAGNAIVTMANEL